MRTALVVGGAGYVGSHCCKALAEAGWNVVVYDNLSRGWAEFVQWGELIEGDILDAARLDEAFATVAPDIVVHLAAVAYVGESQAQPLAYYRNNTAGSFCLLEAMRRAGVSRLIFSSTCASYGDPQTLPIDESHRQQPTNPYGWSKLFVEQMLADHRVAYGLDYVALRYFNAAGASEEGGIGERHQPETHLIPLVLESTEPGFVLTVNGDDFDTPDGTCVRDYVHVSDLATAHVLAADHLFTSPGGHVFNLGTEVGASVADIIAVAEKVTGRKANTRIGPRRPGDPAMLVASAAKARDQLGWRPRYDLEQTIATAAAWWRKEKASADAPPHEGNAS